MLDSEVKLEQIVSYENTARNVIETGYIVTILKIVDSLNREPIGETMCCVQIASEYTPNVINAKCLKLVTECGGGE